MKFTIKYFIYLHDTLMSEKVYLPVAAGKQKFVVVGFIMGSGTEGEPGPPMDDIQSEIGEDLDEGLSVGNEDGDNEPVEIEGKFVINSTVHGFKSYYRLCTFFNQISSFLILNTTLLHHTNNRVHKQQTLVESLRDALL